MFPDVVWLWNAFQFLSETRNYGFGGPLRINASDMAAYLAMRGIEDEDDLQLFLKVIPILDNMWLDDHYQEAKQKREKERAKQNRGGNNVRQYQQQPSTWN